MSEIRATYSGLISLVLTILKMFAGLAFTVIITRLLLPEELGTWRLILGLVSYVVIVHQVISYWSTRESARKIESGTTAIVSSVIFSAGGLLLYFLLAIYTSSNTDAHLDILLAGSIIVPIMIVNRVVLSINYGWKPHLLQIGQIVYSISMLPILFILINNFQLGVFGAILSSSFSYAISLLILLYSGRHKFRNSFQIKFLKNWIKRAWLSLYQYVHSIINSLDVLVFSLITKSVVGLAYFNSAVTIGMICGMAGSIAVASYPKLLSERNTEFLSKNIIHLFYFVIPFTLITIVFSKSGLFILNPIYAGVYPAVIIISIRTFFYLFSNTFSEYVLGYENIDTNLKPTISEQIKSKLFHIPTIRIIRNSIYISFFVVFLLFYGSNSHESIVFFWSLIWLIVEIPFTFYFFYLAKKTMVFKIDKNPILKYFLSGFLIFSVTYLLIENFMEYDQNLFVFLPHLIPFLAFSLIGYFSLTYAIDEYTRKFVKSILKEIKSRTSR